MIERMVYLMRGLPACVKSHRARRLAGTSGIVLETDQYFYTQVGHDPAHYDYQESLLPAARRWNFARYEEAISRQFSPIVIDRGNGLNEETYRYARYAVEHAYQVQLCEPDSPWWQELRVLLKYQAQLDPAVLDRWAERLAAKSRQTHRVPAATIRRWMHKWRWDLTVEAILEQRFGTRINCLRRPARYYLVRKGAFVRC